jgi:light-regulated signal transduction histidine kinase (bacteriophytochrome)
LGQGIVGTVAKTGKSELIKDTSKDDRYIIDDDIRYSEITVPIISDGKVIGVIDSEHLSKDYFTNEQLLMLENIGSLIAMKIKSAINFRERQKVELKNIKLLEELEKSNEALQEYAHVVSHDLKSPLRSINALISWIQEDNKDVFDTSSLENFGLIEMTLEKMEQLISDILLYSSIGSDDTEKQHTDVNQVVKDLKKILFIPRHINVDILNKLPVIVGERAKLQQLFQNLISNAIKFNDKNKGFIEIDVLEKKSFYQFSIKDNGPGIEKKYHDKIFKIFHSLNASNSSSGIGLAIVKKIVNLFNGEIWLESELNEGATFYFTLKK